MSRQYTYMPDEPEIRRSPGKKAKPWCLWQKSRKHWWRSGRYRTREEAETAMRLNQRKWEGWFGKSPAFQKFKIGYAILHEDDGKPE